MDCTYIRSSSYNQYEYCQMSYFLTYNLGWQQTSGKKAQLGTIVHKVMECLATCKKEIQDNPKSTKLEIEDDSLGKIKFTKNSLYTKTFVDKLVKSSYDYYTSSCVHSYSNADFNFCKDLVKMAIEYNDGQFDPRNRKIVQAEPHFDIPIEEDWAKYKYTLPDGKIIEGQLAIKGTIDLVTEVDDGIIEVVDWKGLPLDTKIPTPNGWTTMGEIQIDDEVFDQYGQVCSVVGKSRVKNKPCYKITFDDTTSAICDDEHLWKLANDKTVPVQELRIGDTINVAKPIDCGYIDLPVSPYLLGSWLGDGRNRSCEICSDDPEMYELLRSDGHEIGVNVGHVNAAESRTILNTTSVLRTLNVLHNKHIPEIYFRASFDQRLNLLRGLLDTDGNVNTGRKQAVFTSCNERLANDVKHLALTLGQRPYIYKQTRQTNFTNGENVNVYHVSFRPININPFRLDRKASMIDPNWGAGRSNIRKIISITEEPIQKTQCIAVDSPDNTYLCTENYIPTHNTGRRLNWATGEEKTYEKLCEDPQLLLYNYAISKLFPEYKQAIMSIFFIKDGGPFSMCFDSDDQTKFLSMLEKRFKQIKRNDFPQPVSRDRSSFKCTKLCHFYKNNWKDTNTTMCHYIEDHIKAFGYDETVRKCTKENHSIGYYEAPG